MTPGFALGYTLYYLTSVLFGAAQTTSLQIVGLGLIGALWALHAAAKHGSHLSLKAMKLENLSFFPDNPLCLLFLSSTTLRPIKSRQIKKGTSLFELSVEFDDVLRAIRSGDASLTEVMIL